MACRDFPVSPTTLALFGGLILSVSTTTTWSNEFADDFSTDSLRYEAQTFFQEPNDANVSATPDGVVLFADYVDGDNPSARLRAGTRGMKLSGLFDSENISLEDQGRVRISVRGAVFNDTYAPGENDNNLGDVYLSVNSTVYWDSQENGTDFFVCVGREGANGYEDLNLFDNESCKDFTDYALPAGEEFTLGFVPAGANSVELTFGDHKEILEFPGTMYEPSRAVVSAELQSRVGPGSGSFVIKTLETDAGVDDFTQTIPVLDRYSIGYPGDGQRPRVEDNRVLITQQSPADDGRYGNLFLFSATDYLESTIELSSQSDISEVNNRVSAAMELISINDSQEGGFDGRAGDIRANIYLEARHNGLRRAEYCLYRYEEADSNLRQGLLNEGENRCRNFPLRIEFDTSYRAAIEFDRNNSTVTFRIDGFTHIESFNFPMFNAAQPRAWVEIGARNGGSVIGYLDDIRNSKATLTVSETSQGAMSPTDFPAEPTAEELQVDSSTDAPFDYSGSISFVDDFSNGTTAFGLSRWPRETTVSTIGHYDGALEIQSASSDAEDDRDPNTELQINSAGDEIRIVAALSSRSTVPAGDGEASLDLRATFYNDTQDGGFNDREGDINANLRIKLGGDGRRRITADLRRRNSDGDNEDLEVFDGDDYFEFDLVPELDTPYELVIRLDREQNSIFFSVDDLVREVPLTTGLFEPAQRNISVAAWHRGTSGRSVIRIHSLSTLDIQQDFESGAPAIAPYRPAWNANYPGISVEVVDGRARLEADSRVTSDRNADILSEGVSEFVGGLLELSSESELTTEGAIVIGASGVMYHDVPAVIDDRTGAVFAAIRITATGSGERFVQVCAWRSDDDSFGTSTDLITGNAGDGSYTECQRLETIPEFDVAYPASVSLDRDNSALIYSFAEEEFTYTISSEIHRPVRQFAGVRARATDNNKVVAYVDDLAFAADPVPLSLSDNSLGVDITEFVNAGSNAANVANAASSSGGGGGKLSLLILFVLAGSNFKRMRRGF